MNVNSWCMVPKNSATRRAATRSGEPRSPTLNVCSLCTRSYAFCASFKCLRRYEVQTEQAWELCTGTLDSHDCISVRHEIETQLMSASKKRIGRSRGTRHVQSTEVVGQCKNVLLARAAPDGNAGNKRRVKTA